MCVKDVATLSLPWKIAIERTQFDTIRFGSWIGKYASDFRLLEAYWPKQVQNMLLSAQYLSTQAAALPPSVRPRFLVLEDETGPFAWLVFQLVEFNALKDIREASVWSGISGKLRRVAARLGNFKMLICGNLFFVGQHGWILRPDWAHQAEFLHNLGTGLRQVARREGAKVIVCKDFDAPVPFDKKACLHPLNFQPNMVMAIQPSWSAIDDYLDAMSAKYRTRAKRAFKKREGLYFKELSQPEIELWADQLAELYQGIVAASGFSVACVEANYFPALKVALGRNYRITAAFEGTQLVGFYSTVRNDRILEAHFIGFLPAYNKTHQIYLNMLYHMVEEAIAGRAEKINFARTALEIKSSVGAVAETATVYMAHVHPLLNRFLPWSVRLLEPVEVWEPRHPFKE